MSETFYSILGVDSGADHERIRAAYRERVKESHPDRNDSADAPRQFKRLTTARNVLLDEDDRTTYDTLGHETYVSRHVDSSVWEVSSEQADTPETAAGKTAGRQANRTTRTQSQTSRSGNREGKRQTTHRASANSHRSGASKQRQRDTSRTRYDGGYASAEWQQAPNAYTSTGTVLGAENTSRWRTVVGGIRQVGVWLVVHVVLVVSALVTGGIFVSSVGRNAATSALTGLLVILLVGLVLAVSALNLLVELY